VTKNPLEAPYTVRSIREMLGVSRAVLTGFIEAGFVQPTRGARNEYRFTFQDVVLLRTAQGLQAARIPPRRILSSLKRLKAALPRELPLSGLRITAIGNDIAVRNGANQLEAESGQLLMDFEVAPVRGAVAFLQHAPVTPAAPATVPVGADEWFRQAEELEESGAHADAEAAYRRALELAPDHADAWINLGALLCEAKRCAEAVDLYDQAIRRRPEEPLLHFNRAIALEDQGRLKEAIASYETCLRLAPDLADAHFNAARLHEQLGNGQKAVRHFSAYRRLQR
jgi:tetratricopeptide (TPR) repeat protein